MLTAPPDLTSALMDGLGHIPTATFQNLGESLPERVEVIITAKGGPTTNYFMPMVLEKANMGMVVRYAHTFGHTVNFFFNSS